MRSTSRLFLLMLLCTFLLVGCSRATLVYRNLDTLIPWTLNDYLDLDRTQQRELRQRQQDDPHGLAAELLQSELGRHTRRDL